jgi:hypothetical protein
MLEASVITVDGPPPPKYMSVKDFAISCDQNRQYRHTMEVLFPFFRYPFIKYLKDEHVLIDKFGGDAYQGFFAIYDGHGGQAAAQCVKENLHKVRQFWDFSIYNRKKF